MNGLEERTTPCAGFVVAALVWAVSVLSWAEAAEPVFVINDPLTEYAIGKQDFDRESDPKAGREGYLPISDNQARQDLVTRIGQKLAAAADPDADVENWTFVVRKNKGLNAHAHPGGFICINDGMIQWLTDSKTGQVDEGRLAAVIAHEIAHVTRHHFSNALKHTLALTEYLRMPDRDREAKQQLIISAAFSRSNESEADQYGGLYLVRAGYHYSHAVRFWQTMLDTFGDGGVEQYHEIKADPLTGRLNLPTHPRNVERIQSLSAFAETVLAPAIERFNLGEELLRNSVELELAVELFKGLKQNFPASVEVRNNLAVALHKLYLSRQSAGSLSGQPDLAIFPATELAGKIRMRSRSKSDRKLLLQAIDEYRAALETAARPQIMSNLAWALLETGDKTDLAQADELTKQAAGLAPDDPIVLNARGMVEQRQGRPDRAIALFSKAASGAAAKKSAPPRSLPAQYNLGVVLLEGGKKEQAIEALRAYLQDDPGTVWGERARAQLTTLGVQPPAKPSGLPVTEFAGIPLGAKPDKVVERFGQPAKKTKIEGGGEQWSYPLVGLEFLLVGDTVQRIMQFTVSGEGAKLPLPIERKVLGIGLDDAKAKVESVLGKGDSRKPSSPEGPEEWLTYAGRGVEFALSEGRVFGIIVYKR